MKTALTLPDNGLIRLSQVLKFIQVSRSTLLKGIASGRFPLTPIKNGKIVFFSAEEVKKLIRLLAGQISGGVAA